MLNSNWDSKSRASNGVPVRFRLPHQIKRAACFPAALFILSANLSGGLHRNFLALVHDAVVRVHIHQVGLEFL